MPKGIYIRTEKHKLTHKRQIPWNKGMKNVYSEKSRRRMSDGRKGLKHSETTKRKMSEAKKGSKSYLWKGGITPINFQIRNSLEFRLWREVIFKRDNYICKMCNKRGGKLHAHHIWEFAKYPELRFAINNGLTLCKDCHKKIHKRR